MGIINFVFSGFWVFVGFCLMLSMVLTFILKLSNRMMRHFNILVHGYPPANCDADGDFKQLKQEK